MIILENYVGNHPILWIISSVSENKQHRQEQNTRPLCNKQNRNSWVIGNYGQKQKKNATSSSDHKRKLCIIH